MIKKNRQIIKTIGLIGLGRMGKNLALNIIDHGFSIVVYNRTKAKVDGFINQTKQEGVYSIKELVKKLPQPRTIWIMVSSGKPVDVIIKKLLPFLNKNDIIIDGGNSFYQDSIRREKQLQEKGVRFLDIGTSGGIEGARKNACFMIGGNKSAYKFIQPLIEKIAIKDGYGYFGKAGTGHFIKMVHNGIEYGMMESIGEGFEVLKKYQPNFDFEKIAKVWSNGSVIRGWLMELTQRMFSKNKALKNIPSKIGQSGEGLWTLKEALKLKTPVPAITASIFKRFNSQGKNSFSSRVIQGLRKEFGGHDDKTRL